MQPSAARRAIVSIAAVALFAPALLPGGAAAGGRRAKGDGGPTPADGPTPRFVASDPVTPVLTIPAREAPPPAERTGPARPTNPRHNFNVDFDPSVADLVVGKPDPLLPLQEGAPPAAVDSFDTPLFNFDGQGYTFLNPPDTVGDVGASHYIQMINATEVAVYDKTTGSLIQAFDLTSLGGCATGNGDPVVLYDQIADRWLLSEFGSGNSLCVFVSQSPDPLGAYFSYQFATPGFPDYPKYGVWPDAYYITTNESSPAEYAIDRAAMLAGNPATSQRFTAPSLTGFGFQALTPADLDGATLPPAGAPGYFLRHRDTEAHGPAGMPGNDLLEVWEFHVDFATPANSSFTLVTSISTAEFDSTLCGLSSFFCMAMPGVAQGSGSSLDPIREVIMFRIAYRNFGDHETLVGNFVTDIDGNDTGGVRWFELRKTGAGAWALHQEGTYAPTLTDNRWLGAIAMDGAGNIALGFNVSSNAVFPSLRYVGRLASDPLGTLPQGEHTLIAGTASNGSNRWGDYAAMSVDPVDDCTFWFTGEWNATSQWSTRIGAFRFDACGTPDFFLSASPAVQAVCAPNAANFTVNVGQIAGFTDTVDLGVTGNPPGSATGFSVDPVTPPGSSTLTVTPILGNPGSYTLDISGTSTTGTKHVNVGLDVIDVPPGAPTLVAPADGAVELPLKPLLSWNPVATAASYGLEVATDAGFSSVVISEPTLDDTTYEPASNLVPDTTYYWRTTADNSCGTSSASAVWSFTTGIPRVLLVDDDNNAPDVLPTYQALLATLSINNETWDTTGGEPALGDLTNYEAIVWFSGDKFCGNGAPCAGPQTAAETALGQFLDSGGCALISSQDYLWDMGGSGHDTATPFMASYLGLASATSDNGDYSSVNGRNVYLATGNSPLTYPAGYSDYSDTLVVAAGGQLAFDGNNDHDGGISKLGPTWFTTFLGFGLETLSSTQQQAIFQELLLWCEAARTLHADDFESSGFTFWSDVVIGP